MSRRVRWEEVEAGAGGGFGEVKADEGVGKSDGETRHDAHVDLGLAGADQAAQLVGAVAHRGAGAVLTGGHECGEVVGGDEAGQTVGGERAGRRRGLDSQEVARDEDEERHGGAIVPARQAEWRPTRWLP